MIFMSLIRVTFTIPYQDSTAPNVYKTFNPMNYVLCLSNLVLYKTRLYMEENGKYKQREAVGK